MYTDKKNILQLVALLEAHGITKVVLCRAYCAYFVQSSGLYLLCDD